MDSPFKRAGICHFTIEIIEQKADQTLLTGRLSRPGQLSQGENIYLFLGLQDDGLVLGLLTTVEPDSGVAVVSTETMTLAPEATIGACFPIFYCHQMRNIRLAIDPAFNWTLKHFATEDAFVQPSPTPGWNQSRRAKPDDTERADGKIKPSGWDHEHCQICDRRICQTGDGEREGYVANTGCWLCCRCYRDYIGPRELRFVIEGTADDTDQFRNLIRLVDDYNLNAVSKYLDDIGGVNAALGSGWTALMVASSRGQRSLVELLVLRGAEINAVSEVYGYTALGLAAQGGHFRIAELLLSAGASIRTAENGKRGSLLDQVKWSHRPGSDRVSDLLKNAGAS